VNILLDTAALSGFVLSVTRVGAFAAASPLLKPFPKPGKMAFSQAIGWAFSSPVPQATTLSGMIVAVVANAGIGIVLGFLTGIILYAFEVAGSVIDLNSGLSLSQVLDPISGHSTAVFARAFNLTALALWFVLGGDRLTVEALGATVRAIPLNGAISLAPGLAETAVHLVADMLIAAIQLAIPSIAALMVAEVALGVASRFAPQANVFALGLPAKLVAALATTSLVLAGFPSAIHSSMETTRQLVITTIHGLGG
jgi:flagellar biosynthetic protein FliR